MVSLRALMLPWPFRLARLYRDLRRLGLPRLQALLLAVELVWTPRR